MRLIDADKLKESIEWCKEQSAKCNDSYWDDILERIDVQPTIDAKPVVRCKDCKHAYLDCHIVDRLEYDVCAMYLTDDWFCAYGERREE